VVAATTLEDTMMAKRPFPEQQIRQPADIYTPLAGPTQLWCDEVPVLSIAQVRQSLSSVATLAGQLVIGTDWEQCRLILDLVVRGAEGCGFDANTIDAIRIALQEALANAVKHGNRYGDAAIRVEYQFRADVFRVRVTDQGSGFDPNAVADPTLPQNVGKPTGRGLLMMRHYMTEVRFNERGNSVEMWKRCLPDSEAWIRHRA
jgi:serine/threonine-protein kinase RsbW